MERKSNLFDLLMDNARAKVDNSQLGLYYHLNLLPSLEQYNRADTVNMNEDEMNKFRHIAGTKQAMKDLGAVRGLGFALGKEFDDFRNDGWKDTKFDLKNDFEALKLHLKQPNLEETELSNYVFNNYIKPYRK